MIAALGKPAASGFRACIVSPTRELANQIAREIKLLAGPLQVRLLDKSTASRNSFGPDSSQRFGRAVLGEGWGGCCGLSKIHRSMLTRLVMLDRHSGVDADAHGARAAGGVAVAGACAVARH